MQDQMAWCTESTKQFLFVTAKGHEERWTKRYSPGEKVPVSGIYRCIACKKEVTSNAQNDDRFPPPSHHSHPNLAATKWQLIVRTNTDGS